MAGGITYPLYLIHDRIGLTLIHALNGTFDRWAQLAFLLPSMCVVAYAIWRFYEQPVTRLLRRVGLRLGL